MVADVLGTPFFWLGLNPTTKMFVLLVGHCCHAVRHRGHRWHCNLWPLPPGQRLGASATPALSFGVQVAASGPHCHLGSYWHHEPTPTWQACAHTHTAGRGHCHLPAICLSFCTTTHAEPIRPNTQTHGALHTCGGNALPDIHFTSLLQALLAWNQVPR